MVLLILQDLTGGRKIRSKSMEESNRARVDILCRDAANIRREARRQPAGKRYNKARYDGNQAIGEES
jgi:hypothetical protein